MAQTATDPTSARRPFAPACVLCESSHEGAAHHPPYTDVPLLASVDWWTTPGQWLGPPVCIVPSVPAGSTGTRSGASTCSCCFHLRTLLSSPEISPRVSGN